MRTFKNKVLFKLFRLPIPWGVRRAINDILFRLSRRRIDSINSVSELHDNGYIVTTIEHLGFNKYEFFRSLAEIHKSKVHDQWREIPGEYNVNDIPGNMNVGEVILEGMLRESVAAIGDQLRHHHIIQGYFSGTPALVNCSVWWSFGGRIEKAAQLWHRDIDNIFFLKVFIYLTDVGVADGPHHYIPKSHRFSKHLTFRRFDDAQISNVKGLESPISVIGEKGCVIIEDTFGFHKGSSPAPGRSRLLLQYQYACFSNP